MPQEMQELPQWAILFVTWLASLFASGAGLYIAWRKMLRTGTQAKTDTSSLELIGAAVSHWKGLHDEAWEQVKAERKRRGEAEDRLTKALTEIEKLRGEVAELRRDIANLSAMASKQGLDNGSH